MKQGKGPHLSADWVKQRRDLEVCFVAVGDPLQLVQGLLSPALHQQPTWRLRNQPGHHFSHPSSSSVLTVFNSLPSSEDGKNCQGGRKGEKPPGGHEHGHPGEGEGGEGVAHHHHQQGHRPA